MVFGRRAELNWLRAAMDRARGGLPTLVIVEGPAGIGKTALVRRFVTLTRRARVLWAAGEEAERELELALADSFVSRQ